MTDLHDPHASELAWLTADDDTIISALNFMPPFPNLDFLRWVRANRPALLETVRFAMQATGEWEHELEPYDDEVRRLLEE